MYCNLCEVVRGTINAFDRHLSTSKGDVWSNTNGKRFMLRLTVVREKYFLIFVVVIALCYNTGITRFHVTVH